MGGNSASLGSRYSGTLGIRNEKLSGFTATTARVLDSVLSLSKVQSTLLTTMEKARLVKILQWLCNRRNDLLHDMSSKIFVWGSQTEGGVDIWENIQSYDAEMVSMGAGLGEVLVEARQALIPCLVGDRLQCLDFRW